MTPLERSLYHPAAFNSATALWRQRFFGWVIFFRTPEHYGPAEAETVARRLWAGGRAFPLAFIPFGEEMNADQIPLETL